jgi:hypothetical protein
MIVAAANQHHQPKKNRKSAMHASADAASGVIALVLLRPVPFKLAFFRSCERVKIASLSRVAHKLLDRVFEPVTTPLGRPSIDVVAMDVSGELARDALPHLFQISFDLQGPVIVQHGCHPFSVPDQ